MIKKMSVNFVFYIFIWRFFLCHDETCYLCLVKSAEDPCRYESLDGVIEGYPFNSNIWI